jgi:hypothetical protein
LRWTRASARREELLRRNQSAGAKSSTLDAARMDVWFVFSAMLRASVRNLTVPLLNYPVSDRLQESPAAVRDGVHYRYRTGISQLRANAL